MPISTKSQKLVVTTVREMQYLIDYERQKNLISMQTTGFASAAHEFRNPLNAINSSIELLDSEIKDPAKRRYYLIAKNCSNLMTFLLKDILDFAQIQEKRFAINV